MEHVHRLPGKGQVTSTLALIDLELTLTALLLFGPDRSPSLGVILKFLRLVDPLQKLQKHKLTTHFRLHYSFYKTDLERLQAFIKEECRVIHEHVDKAYKLFPRSWFVDDGMSKKKKNEWKTKKKLMFFGISVPGSLALDLLVNDTFPHWLENDTNVVANWEFIIKFSICTRRFHIRVKLHEGRGQVLFCNGVSHYTGMKLLRPPWLQLWIDDKQDFDKFCNKIRVSHVVGCTEHE